MNEVAINIATFENVTRFLDNESVGKIVKALILFSNGESEECCQNTLDNGLKSAFSILAAEEKERMKKSVVLLAGGGWRAVGVKGQKMLTMNLSWSISTERCVVPAFPKYKG